MIHCECKVPACVHSMSQCVCIYLSCTHCNGIILYNISLYQLCDDVEACCYGVDNGSQWQQLLDNEHS